MGAYLGRVMQWIDRSNMQTWALLLAAMILVGLVCMAAWDRDPVIELERTMELWTNMIWVPLALAVFATLGYLFGRSSRPDLPEAVLRSRREFRRAQMVAGELEKIAWELRKSLSQHHSSVMKFRERVGRLSEQQREVAWKELCREAEDILRPTMRLAAQIASAHDEIRQQSANLMAFTEVRTDPLTGVNNRRGLDDALSSHWPC